LATSWNSCAVQVYLEMVELGEATMGGQWSWLYRSKVVAKSATAKWFCLLTGATVPQLPSNRGFALILTFALLSSDELALSEYSQNLSSVLLGAVEANAAALTIDAGLN
jgi:hypothetical protein